MRRKFLLTAALALWAMLFTIPFSSAALAATESGWDAAGEVARLSREAPSIAAFPDASAVIWLSAYDYSLLSDGTMRKQHRVVMMLGEAESEGAVRTWLIPHPLETDASVAIRLASWFDPQNGRSGELPQEEYDRDGIHGIVVTFPDEVNEKVVAIETITTYPMRYYMDDVLDMAGEFPIWEQFVTATIPDGMNFYWEGTGIRTPERIKQGGTERITWTVLNQPAWESGGIVDERKPTLLFSLQQGLIPNLKNLWNLEMTFRAPPVPASVRNAAKGNLVRAGESISAYLAERRLEIAGYEPSEVRPHEIMPEDGPWTLWERTLLAGKWLHALGWDVTVLWTQRLPVGQEGPSSTLLWREPVLRIEQEGGKEVYFKAGQNTAFGKLPPMLYGEAAYRFDGTNVERLVFPKGSASDHVLAQNWRMQLGEGGLAAGTLDITVSGGWVDVLGLGRMPASDGLAEAVQKLLHFPIPGFALTAKSVRQVGTGYRMSFDVRATLGIVSGNDILLRIPGAVPVCLDEIPRENANYAFRFPFILEQNAVISTPKGYQAIVLPNKVQAGDAKATLEESIVHWTRRAQAETSSKLTVRSTAVDEYASRRVNELLDMSRSWSQTTIPLRK